MKGVGHKSIDDNWWQSVYNKASQNVSVDKDFSGVSVNIIDKSAKIFSKNEDLVEIQKKHNSGYKEFIKTSTLKDGLNVQEINEKSATDTKLQIGFDSLMISDEELFKACGGRTAHKGARHGLNLSGKLARIAKQEEELSLTSIVASDNNNKKKTRTKKKIIDKEKFVKDESIVKTSSVVLTKKEEKKEKKRKRKEIVESEEDVDDDKQEIAHLMNNSKSPKCQLTKSQRKTCRRKINSLVELLDKNFSLEESEKNEICNKKEGTRKKKKIEDNDNDLVLQTSFPLFREDEDFLTTFKDLTFKRYEEQNPTKFYRNIHNKKRDEKVKKIDELSDVLNDMCTLDEAKKEKSKKKRAKKYSVIDFDEHISKIDANKLNSKIQKKKLKRKIKTKICEARDKTIRKIKNYNL